MSFVKYNNIENYIREINIDKDKNIVDIITHENFKNGELAIEFGSGTKKRYISKDAFLKELNSVRTQGVRKTLIQVARAHPGATIFQDPYKLSRGVKRREIRFVRFVNKSKRIPPRTPIKTRIRKSVDIPSPNKTITKRRHSLNEM